MFVADVTKDKVQCFLNRISRVYSNIDGEIIHGNQIGQPRFNLFYIGPIQSRRVVAFAFVT